MLWKTPTADKLLADQMRDRGARSNEPDPDAPLTPQHAKDVFFVMPEIDGYMVAPQDVGPEWVFASEVAANNRARRGSLQVIPLNGRSAHARAAAGFDAREAGGYHDPADIREVPR